MIALTMFNISVNMLIMLATTLIHTVKKLRQQLYLFRLNRRKKKLKRNVSNTTTIARTKKKNNVNDDGLRLQFEIHPVERENY